MGITGTRSAFYIDQHKYQIVILFHTEAPFVMTLYLKAAVDGRLILPAWSSFTYSSQLDQHQEV